MGLFNWTKNFLTRMFPNVELMGNVNEILIEKVRKTKAKFAGIWSRKYIKKLGCLHELVIKCEN